MKRDGLFVAGTSCRGGSSSQEKVCKECGLFTPWGRADKVTVGK